MFNLIKHFGVVVLLTLFGSACSSQVSVNQRSSQAAGETDEQLGGDSTNTPTDNDTSNDNPSPAQDQSQNLPKGLQAFQDTVYAFARDAQNCMACHSSAQQPLFAHNDLATAYQAAKDYVDFKESESSTLVEKAGDGHCGSAFCQDKSAAMTVLVNAWYEQGEKPAESPAPMDDPDPTPDPDPDPAPATPVVQFSVSSISTTEDAGTLNLLIQSNLTVTSNITIAYTVSGSATLGSDHRLQNGNVVIANSSNQVILGLPIIDDNSIESSEVVLVTLSSASGANLGTRSTIVITINDNDVAPPPAPTTTAYEVIQNKCLNCHMSRGWGSPANEAELAGTLQALGQVIPGNLNDSPFIQYTRFSQNDTDSYIGTMPLGGMSFTQEEYNLLRSWVINMEASEPEDPAPAPTPPDNSGALVSSEGKTRIGDRFYVKAVLTDVFGSGVESITNDMVFRKASAFGGSCDPKDGSFCQQIDLNSSRHSLIPGTNPMREGWRLKACQQIVFRDAHLDVAHQKATGSASYALPTKSQIATAYQLFFPGYPNQSNLVDTLFNASQQAASKFSTESEKEAWRFVFYTLCATPDWQMP